MCLFFLALVSYGGKTVALAVLISVWVCTILQKVILDVFAANHSVVDCNIKCVCVCVCVGVCVHAFVSLVGWLVGVFFFGGGGC